MMMKKYILISMFIIILLNISCISAEDISNLNNDLTMNPDINSNNILNEYDNRYPEEEMNNIYIDPSIGNDNNTGENWQTPLQSIKKAIELAPNNTTTNIYLNNGTYTGENNTRLTIENKNIINIIGSTNTIINGENIGHIFIINNNTKITLQNIQFTDGYINNTESKAAALNIENNTEIIILNCQFTNNTLKTQVIHNENQQITGGAVNAKNNTKITIKNSIFKNNTGVNGGAINIQNSSELLLLNNTFMNNKVAINYLIKNTTVKHAMVEMSGTYQQISYTDYSNAYMEENYGGAVYLENNKNTIINNNNFTNNTANNGGSMMLKNNRNTRISNITFTNNRLIFARRQGGSYNSSYDLKTSNYGNAIYIYNTTAIINNITLKNNNGGLGSMKIDNSNVTITNATVTNNVATRGTGIYNGGNLTLINAIFINNDGSLFLGTSQETIIKDYLDGIGIDIYNKGHAMINNATFTTTENFTFRQNTIGGSIYNKGTMTLNNTEISNKNAAEFSYGSAIANIGNITIINSILKDNLIGAASATVSPTFTGAIHNEGLLTATKTIFQNNMATGLRVDTWNHARSRGSGNIHNTGNGALNITNCIFLNKEQYLRQDSSYNNVNYTLATNIMQDIFFTKGSVISLENNYWNGEPPTSNGHTNCKNINDYYILDFTEYNMVDINEIKNITLTVKLNKNPENSIKLPFDNLNLTINTTINGENIIFNRTIKNNTASFLFNWTQEKGLYAVHMKFITKTQKIAHSTGYGYYYKNPVDKTHELLIDCGKEHAVMNVNINNTITFGENLTFNLTITGNYTDKPTGNIILYITDIISYKPSLYGPVGVVIKKEADQIHNLNIINGTVEFNKEIFTGSGSANIKLIYEGDENYFRTGFYYNNITIKRLKQELEIEIPEVYVGEELQINVSKITGSERATGYFYVDNIRWSKVIFNEDNITLTFKNAYWLNNHGTYTIKVTSDKTANYESSSVTGILIVKRYETELKLNASDIMVGENLTINATLLPEAVPGGNANITINNQTHPLFLDSGTTPITLYNLTAGTYNITIKYFGTNKYSPATANTTITVHKYPSNLTVERITYDNLTGTITVTALGTGNVTLWINQKNYTQKLKNNAATFHITYDNGTNYIFIYYTGDEKYEYATWNTTENITYKYFLKAENMTYYQNEEFTYNITLLDGSLKPLEDYVTIKFNNTVYKIKTDENGTIKFPLKLPQGTYSITVQYNQSILKNMINITTANITPEMNITSYNITYGEKLTIKINITPQATGTITIQIDNQTQTVNIIQGYAEATFENVTGGEKTITATYNGDNKYRVITREKQIKVARQDTILEIRTGNITADENIYIYASTNKKDATGTVTFSIIELYNPRNRTLENNLATWLISPLARGQYIVTATYNGNQNYNPSHATYILTIDPEVNITLNTPDTEYGEEIIIDAFTQLRGTINFKIADINQNVTIENGKATLKINKALNTGNYTVKAVFIKDNFHSETITGNLTIIKTSPIKEIYIKDVLAGQTEIINITLKDNTLKYIILLDNRQYSQLNINIPQINTGEHVLHIEITGDDNYESVNQTIMFHAKIQSSEITIKTSNIVYGEILDIKSTITENATGNITYQIGNRTITTPERVISIKNLPAGTYTLTVTYNGNEYYQSSTTTQIISVSKAEPDLDISIDAKTSQDPVNITVKINSDATGNITYTIKGLYSPRNHTIKNGKDQWLIEALANGEYELEITYNGDNNYNSKIITQKININQIKTHLTANVTINPDNSLTITAHLTSDDNARIDTDITLAVSNKFYKMKITNNTGIYTTPALSNGNHRYSLAYAGTTKYASSNTNGAITVKENIETQVENIINDNNTITFKITSNKNTNATLTINNQVYDIQIKNYTATITTRPLELGEYTYTIKYPEYPYYDTTNTTNSITIKQTPQIQHEIEINPDNSITITIDTTLEKADLTLEINNRNYLVKINNHTGLYTTPTLAKGNYTYKIIYDGDTITKKHTQTGTISIKNNATIKAEDLIKYYSSPERLNIILTYQNQPLANENIYITINGKTYKKTTNQNGRTTQGINLPSGTYPATITFNNTLYNTINKKVTIQIKNTIYANNITKIYRNNTQYHAIFTDNNGNQLVNTQVTFNINGVFYTRTTNDHGIARLNLNLEQGTYILTAHNPVTQENYANKITILPKIQENKDIIKYYKNGTQYTVKIINPDGSAAKAGEEVTFNINGVFYTRTTNNLGIARLNLNLHPGTYIITAEYQGCKVSNNITILTIIKTNNLIKKYGDNLPFTATLLDGTGKPLKNTQVTFNINGVFYTRTTNDQGVARLNIKLQSGKYIITTSYNGLNTANTVTVRD